MTVLKDKGFVEPLREYLKAGRPYLGICLGMQMLFESSEEGGEGGGGVLGGLGIVPGTVTRFDSTKMTVPQIGWNGRTAHQDSPVFRYVKEEEEVYFVHSYHAEIVPSSEPTNGDVGERGNEDWILTSTCYGGKRYVSSVQKGGVVACQFHPEKSGSAGLNFIRGFLEAVDNNTISNTKPLTPDLTKQTQLVKRVVVALDVRQNDDGDLVVTKGDQYDVREEEDTETTTTTSGKTTDDTTTKKDEGNSGKVRNLGKPISLATRYYTEGADEIVFLNITSFRSGVIEDMPMLTVLQQASQNIFVPLTVGGGIRNYTDPVSGKQWDALEVASRYFRAGADKISIGGDSVLAAEEWVRSGGVPSGKSSIEVIAGVYGAQAVVVSIDPKRVYLSKQNKECNTRHTVLELPQGQEGPNGEKFCWYQCTIKGGREERNICAVTVARASQSLGAGEIMLNCIDMDGQCQGYDHTLLNAVCHEVTIPVIASSGAGKAEHFKEVFEQTGVQAALAAGMFHRKEVEIESVKKHMASNGIPSRTWSRPEN